MTGQVAVAAVAIFYFTFFCFVFANVIITQLVWCHFFCCTRKYTLIGAQLMVLSDVSGVEFSSTPYRKVGITQGFTVELINRIAVYFAVSLKCPMNFHWLIYCYNAKHWPEWRRSHIIIIPIILIFKNVVSFLFLHFFVLFGNTKDKDDYNACKRKLIASNGGVG